MRGSGAKAISVCLTGLLSLFLLLPFLWLVNASFQRYVELFSRPPTWLPHEFYFSNYTNVLHDAVLIRSLLNSSVISLGTVGAALLIGAPAAYALARLAVPHGGKILLIILATQMLPGTAILIPLYVIFRKWGLIYTYQGLILGYLSFSLPYVIWLLRAYFLSIPVEIEEAARIDGCSRWGAIRHIFVPLAIPGMVSTAVFVFIGVWNEFMLATILTNDATKTIPVKLAQYVGEESTAYEAMYSSAVIFTLPALILVIILRRYVQRGLMQGAVKL